MHFFTIYFYFSVEIYDSECYFQECLNLPATKKTKNKNKKPTKNQPPPHKKQSKKPPQKTHKKPTKNKAKQKTNKINLNPSSPKSKNRTIL